MTPDDADEKAWTWPARSRAVWPWTKIPAPVALPSRFFPNRLDEYTWEDWADEARAMYPVRYFLQQSLPRLFRRAWWPFPHAWYWIRTHTYNRYHIVDLRCPTWGLEYEWGWADASERIFLAAFQVLKEFVEHEYPGMVAWTPEVAAEIQELHLWWTIGRKQAWLAHRAHGAALGNDRHAPGFKAYLEEGDALDALDDTMLTRLIAVRIHLWT
jgi:hypothetical protein